MVKNLPANRKMKVIGVQALAQEDLLEEGMATHPSILHIQRSLVGYSPRGCRLGHN